MSSYSYVPNDIAAIDSFIDTWLRSNHDKVNNSKPRNYSYYHPSEVGSCARLLQYKRFAYEGHIRTQSKELGSKNIRLFDKGHNMHARWQKYFADIGILRGVWRCLNSGCYLLKNGEVDHTAEDKEKFQKGHTRIFGRKEKLGIFCPEQCICGNSNFAYEESRVEDKEMNIGGNCDGILDFSNFDYDSLNNVVNTFDKRYLPTGPIIIDMKTIKQDKFDSLTEPSIEYLYQLTTYIHIMGCEYGVLMYECKNDSQIKTFKIDRNDDLFNTIKERIRKMNEMYEYGVLPPPMPEKKSSINCYFCEAKDLCHASSIWNNPKIDELRKEFYGE